MNVDDVRERLAEIEKDAKRGDNEAAHCLQDDLWLDVLKAIADGAEDAKELAAEALKAEGVEFTRWYA